MPDLIQLRRDTAANWTSVNPTLAQGEIGVETDTRKLKIGDGTTAWDTLDYAAGGVTDHGALTGLSDDDHTQYLNNTRGDARYAALSHTQDISTVTGLQDALDGKQPLATVLTNTTAAFTTAQETKLAGIEVGADVTDATNVNAAGAVMNSDYNQAHSVLVQQSSTGSPSVLQVSNNTLVGRLAGGGSDIASLSATSVRGLLNVADGATANSSDATLLDRANHTGTQDISTVTGLQTALDGKLDDSQASIFGLSLLDDTDATEARTTLGLGSVATINTNGSTNQWLRGDGTFSATVTAANHVTNIRLADMASGTIKGRVSAATGDPEDLTGTQVTTLLDTFTSTLKGLAPASGGGTSNFLRADGIWAAPTASVAWGGITGTLSSQTDLQTALNDKQATLVSATNIKTINGVSILGSGDLVVGGGSSDPLVLASTDATAPSAGELKIFRREVAGLQMPAYVGPVGSPVLLQDHFGSGKVGGVFSRGNIATFITYGCFLAPTNTGFTGTARNSTTTNYFTRTRKTGLVSAATAGAIGLFRQAVTAATLGNGSGLGGFFFQITFGISDAAAVAGARMFVGAAPTNPTLTNVEPSTILNCIGVGHRAADTNLHIFYGGTTAQTPIDLGANFPANTRSTDMYRLTLHSPSNEADVVYYQVDRLNTGHTASGRLTGDAAVLPQSNTYLDMPNCFRTNNATPLAVAIDVANVYLKTEF